MVAECKEPPVSRLTLSTVQAAKSNSHWMLQPDIRVQTDFNEFGSLWCSNCTPPHPVYGLILTFWYGPDLKVIRTSFKLWSMLRNQSFVVWRKCVRLENQIRIFKIQQYVLHPLKRMVRRHKQSQKNLPHPKWWLVCRQLKVAELDLPHFEF